MFKESKYAYNMSKEFGQLDSVWQFHVLTW